jgi:hypothetical protein
MTAMDEGMWDAIGGVEVDAGTVGFGDRVALGPNFWLNEPFAAATGAPEGFEGRLVVEGTGEDCPLPVEVLVDTSGSVVAARMEFVNDVAEQEGEWQETGFLDLSTGRCLACDPFCHRAVYRFEFDVEPGRYVAERFVCTDDGMVLGLRIRLLGSRGRIAP